MGELDKNIHRREKDPYEKILFSPLEKDKRQKEESHFDLKKTDSTQTFSILASYLQKLGDLIGFRHSTPYHTALQRTLKDIKSFRKLLVILAGEDSSHNAIFNQQLSELWHNLLSDCNSLPSEEGGISTLSSRLKFFIGQIQNFPIGSEHTLGYYFSHDVGKEWIPFPCMKILQELHEEFLQAPSHSTLHNWILLLDDLLLMSTRTTDPLKQVRF